MAKMKQIQIDIDVSRVIEANRYSFSEKENDILRRLLLTTSKPTLASVMTNVTKLDAPQFGSRSRGHWQVKFGDAVVAANSLKDAYCNLLLLAHQSDDQFLERFSRLQGRARRYVARTGPNLYLKSPHLSKDHAAALTDGWFVDTNLSEEQVHIRARAAAREAGLPYGRDVWVKQGDRLI
jgi:negative regulator of replication initiation